MTAVFTDVSRRSFLKWSGAVAGASALVSTGVAVTGKPGIGPENAAYAASDGMADADKTVWNACMVNCGSRCPVRLQVKDGTVVRVLQDNTGTDELGSPQLRACVRGRSIKTRIYSADRIKKPLRRRPGTKRGDGFWDEITWDEAIDEIAGQYKRIIETYGNEALYFQYGSGSTGGNICKRSSWTHLMDVLGGYLGFYADYSTAMITIAAPYLFGKGWVGSNSLEDAKNSKLQILWGNNPNETRMSGGGELFVAQQTRRKYNVRTIVIDPRYSETAVDMADEWVPVRPGTDAALVAGMAYVMITENLHDQEFLDKYTIGFDEEHMPDGIPPGNSYKSYILGEGEDKTPKTPEWASKICGVPADRIISLAREIATSKPCAITQGWGVQRQANGEQTCRAIMMMAIMTGNVGISGGGTGARETGYKLPVASYPNYKNPIKTKISCVGWFEAIENGEGMTATKDGVQNADRLKSSIKLMVNACTNTTMNQHSDVERTRALLRDESKLEYYISHDHQWTPTVDMADIVLPATTNFEETDLVPGGSAGEMGYVILARQAIDPLFEAKSGYEVGQLICKKMDELYAAEGKQTDYWQRFTEGLTQEEWVSRLINETREKVPELPSEAELEKLGVWRKYAPKGMTVPYKDFREDPEANPLKTESGKIEIFSKELWRLNQEWEMPNPPEKGDAIYPLPIHVETWEDAQEAKETGKLQCIGHHYKGRTHSSYANLPWINEANRQELWINPLDATPRGIKNGDMLEVESVRGKVHVPAKVTPRIMPGVTSLPQGAWTKRVGDVDVGANVNTLDRHRFSPLAKGNPQHTCLVTVKKIAKRADE